MKKPTRAQIEQVRSYWLLRGGLDTMPLWQRDFDVISIAFPELAKEYQNYRDVEHELRKRVDDELLKAIDSFPKEPKMEESSCAKKKKR